jgi:predicted RecA/RadA family phage recombinase
MNNFVQPGDVQEFTATGTITSGQPYQVGMAFGIAAISVASGARFVMKIRGVFSVTKPGSQAWTEGAAIYYDIGANVFTTTVGDNRLVGWAAAAVGSGAGETTGQVYLDGVARAADTT